MGVALQMCDQLLWENRWQVLDRQVLWLPTGPEALWCVAHPAAEIKAHCADLEQTHPLGRLWDLDVICPQHGHVGRQSLGRISALPDLRRARARLFPFAQSSR
jgi:holo-ACP synthase